MLRQLERHRAAGAKAGDDIGPVRPERPYLVREVAGYFLDAGERFAVPVQPRRLQPEERPLVAQDLGERPIAEDIAVMAGDGEHRHLRSILLQRHDGALLGGDRVRRAQECHDFVLALLQLRAQFVGQRAGAGIAAQLLSVYPDVDVEMAQLG